METELRPTVSFGRSKSKNSLVQSDEDDNNTDNDDEAVRLIKKSKSSSQLNVEDSSLYGTNRNINTPVFQDDPNNTNADDFESFESRSQSRASQSTSGVFSRLKLPQVCVTPAHKIARVAHIISPYLGRIKQIALVAYCVVCMIVFGIYDTAEDKWTQTVVSNASFTYLECHSHSSTLHSSFYRLKLNGPFIDLDNLSRREINSGKYVNVTAYARDNLNVPLAKSWNLIIKLPDDSTKNLTMVNKYSENTLNVKNLKIETHLRSEEVVMVVDTNEKSLTAFVFSCEQLSPAFDSSILLSAIILVFVYVLIMFELVHRALAAFMGSLGGLALLAMIDMEKPSLLTIVTWVEWETILLMFGMMVIVSVFCETGLFDLLAFRIFHFAGSRIWVMISCLCLFAALLSAFLDNVTTILLLTPITIRLCEVMGLDARLIIIAEVIFSNIGGVSTAIGDPPNVIITANPVINERGIDFANFTAHMFVGTLFIYASTFLQYRLTYSNPMCFLRSRETEYEEMRKEITIWRRTYRSITPVTKEEKIVRTLLREKVGQLEDLLSQRIRSSALDLEQSLTQKSKELAENYRIHDKRLLVICSIVFSMTLLLFFVHPFIHSFHLSVGWIAAISALVLLVSTLTGHQHQTSNDGTKPVTTSLDLESILHKVEWATLLFFAGLFVFMRCVEELGLLKFLADTISDVIKSVENESDRLVFALLMLIVISALVSSLIDNIPFTTAMIPIIIQLSEQADLPIQPLVYALAFGSCLGGNGTLIGASCNLVAAGIAEQHGIKITFKKFFQVAFPIMINSILVAIVYMCITSVYFKWY